MRNLIVAALAAVTVLTGSVAEGASVRGRADLGGTVFVIRQLENNKKVQDIWMGGPRFDATIIPCDDYGFCLKPSLMYGYGDGEVFTAGLSVGHYTPINDCISIIPHIGWSYFSLQTKTDVIRQGFTFRRVDLDAVSNSLVVGNDFVYTINEYISMTATVQYAWARTNNKVQGGVSSIALPLTIEKGRSSGFNFALGVDYYFCDCWLANATVGYQSSLDKSKIGSEALGLKLAVGRTF